MTTAVSGYKITDYTFLATDLEIMHARLSGDNETEALDMRQDMAASIMEMYEANGSSISEKEALAIIDQQYKYMSDGASIVDTINATTKGADSIWNKVPIVSWFIDNTTAEDLYDYMENGTNAKMEETNANATNDIMSSRFLVAATAGAGLGLKFGCAVGSIGGPAGSAAGAALGAIIGGAFGLVTGWLESKK